MSTAASCREIRHSLGVYVLGAIEPSDRAQVDEHLATCADCREELASLAGLPALLRRVPTAEAERLAVAGQLRGAIHRREITVLYQTKVDLKTNEICGLEALVRWRHPRFGLLGPDEFVPAAERNGAIQPLTREVLEQAVWRCREWRCRGQCCDAREERSEARDKRSEGPD